MESARSLKGGFCGCRPKEAVSAPDTTMLQFPCDNFKNSGKTCSESLDTCVNTLVNGAREMKSAVCVFCLLLTRRVDNKSGKM